MKRKLLSLALAFVMACSLVVPAAAQSANERLSTVTAQVKRTLGLDTTPYTEFYGKGTCARRFWRPPGSWSGTVLPETSPFLPPKMAKSSATMSTKIMGNPVPALLPRVFPPAAGMPPAARPWNLWTRF